MVYLYIFIGLEILGLGICIAKHGEPSGEYNFWTTLVGGLIELWLLYKAGLFDILTKQIITNKEEFLKAEKVLKEEFEAKKKQLLKELAFSNNPVKIGDIITDHYKTICVEELLYDYNLGTPFSCMFYRGTRLNKKGKPMKLGADDNIVAQTNIREINGKPYKYELK